MNGIFYTDMDVFEWANSVRKTRSASFSSSCTGLPTNNTFNIIRIEQGGRLATMIAIQEGIGKIFSSTYNTDTWCEWNEVLTRDSYTLNNLITDIFRKSENNRISNADTAPFGISVIDSDGINSPFNFWSTLVTTGQEWYTQQLALPWSYADKSLKYRVKDSGVWSEWIEFVPNPDIKYFKELKLIRNGKFINTTPAFTYHGYVNGWDEQMDKSMLPTLEGTWWDIQYFPSIYEDNDRILADSQAKMIAINSNGDLYIRTHQQNGWGNWKLK